MIPEELARNLANPQWRLGNLYVILNRDGETVPFRPNRAQRRFMARLHLRNIILKARQLGFSTFIQLAALDQCIFIPNFAAGIIAHTLDDAEAFLKRIVFAYENLPQAIRDDVRIISRNQSRIEFSNGSSIKVDTSMRGGTLQFLHVSEFGKICAKFPEKATEIISGSLPAVATTGMVFIESTAEGREGHFYRLCQEAEQLDLAGRKLTPLDFKFHFYDWTGEPSYRIDPEGVAITPADTEYFDTLERQKGITIDAEQRAWYVATRNRLGPELMLREYPSTPEEAFRASVAGRYYTQQVQRAWAEKRIGAFPWLSNLPVSTFWDIGANDETALWLMQRVQGRYRFFHYYEASGEPFSHFVAYLQNLGCVWDTHWLPHDATHKRQQGVRNDSAEDMLRALAPGWRFEIVPRIDRIQDGIQQVRDIYPQCEFDEAGCKQGLLHMENYRKQWNDRLGTWRDEPLHDTASNGADAFRQFAQTFTRPPAERGGDAKPKGYRRKATSWRAA